MTLSPDDLAAMGERHRPEPERRLIPICVTCLEDWPCDSRRLLDEVEALRSALELIESRTSRYIHSASSVNAVVYHARDTARRVLNSEEVMTPEVTEPST